MQIYATYFIALLIDVGIVPNANDERAYETGKPTFNLVSLNFNIKQSNIKIKLD